ncbi:KH domain-containing protein HEN4 [Cornus florida]|uniref:KH domain-containing protein HEN4 n=1 Tax=Cornus florida TaxID=4283 RepID=UPI00289A73F2|nr:KH domain-containing protein HEN4 [Cornus florida]
MEASFVPKTHYDSSTVDRIEPYTTTSSTKRRHPHPPPSTSSSSSSAAPSSLTFKQPPPPLTLFRILCPGNRTGSVIGKGGAIVRQLREETGAKIRIDDYIPGCEERVIVIVADSTKKETSSSVDGKQSTDNFDTNGGESANSSSNWNGEDEGSPAQLALVRVFEKMLKVDEERGGVSAESERGEEKKEEGDNAGAQEAVSFRLLAPSNQVGCVLGRGGKIVEKIRHDTGAQVRVLPKEHLPVCASPGDELIQITGNYSAVRKALLSVSGCLQDNPRAEGMALQGTGLPAQGDLFPQQGFASGFHTVDHHSRGYSSVTGTENIGASYRMGHEEEVVFKLLCQIDKVGSLIGKGGSIIRALMIETGASIKIADAPPDSDEKVVVISARENADQRHSVAQEAVIRVHCRIAEIGFEPGAAVVARLLVHSQQIGCLLGRGGIIIAELRRVTGASIRIFPKEQVPKCGSQNDEVVQVIGSLQSVQDALFQITGRLRETVFPVNPHLSSVEGSQYMSPYPEMPPPLYRPRHDNASPPRHYPSSVGLPRSIDRVAMPAPSFDPQPGFSYGTERVGPTYPDRVPYPYGSERPGHGPLFDRQSSPRRWNSQAVGSGSHRGNADVGGGLASTSGPIGRNQASIAASTSVEVVIPRSLLSHVYGENNGNLGQIRQISGAKVVVQDPRAGATEGLVVLSGTPDQTRAAQSLIQAFILAEQPF